MFILRFGIGALIGMLGSYARSLPPGSRMPSEPVLNASCPCVDKSLCRTPTVQHARELFGFGGNQWEYFDWTQLTTVAWAADPKIICQAHKSGARVIARSPPVIFSPDKEERKAWIDKLIVNVKSRFFDGVTFDYESPLSNLPDSDTYLNLTYYVALVNETTAAMHAAIPGSQVSVCVAWSPDDIDGRNYDNVGLADSSDFLYVMAYDTQSQIYGRCIAQANTPLSRVQYGITRYLQQGIPKEKLVLGTPWYGYVYPCLNAGPADDVCQLKLVHFRGVSCSDAAGYELAFMDIMNLYDRNVCPPTSKAAHVCRVTRKMAVDESTQSPYFNFLADGKLHQVWFDDPASSKLKYSAAAKLGVRGVGPYEWDDLDNTAAITGNPGAIQESKSMWQALKAFSQASESLDLHTSSDAFTEVAV